MALYLLAELQNPKDNLMILRRGTDKPVRAGDAGAHLLAADRKSLPVWKS